jgi:hypothetical protein
VKKNNLGRETEDHTVSRIASEPAPSSIVVKNSLLVEDQCPVRVRPAPSAKNMEDLLRPVPTGLRQLENDPITSATIKSGSIRFPAESEVRGA